MREWLTVIIVLLIAGIVLDGLRRVRRSRRESLRLSRNVRKLDEEDLPDPNTEIFGEPRVVTKRDTQDAQSLTRSMRESFAKSRLTAGAPNRIPEQVALNLQESVPMLMESVEDAAAEQPRRDYTQPPSWAEPARATDEPSLGNMDDLADEELSAARPAEPAQAKSAKAKSAKASPASAKKPAAKSEAREEKPAPRDPEEVLIMNLMAPAGEHFEGRELLDALLEQGLRFGSMNIFHRHKQADGSGPVQFSLANMVVPGTFDLSSMDDFTTPGVSVFLSLPNEDDSLEAFESMVRTVKALAERLGGELKDENRSVMTRQTIEHSRQRVVEFERKRRLVSHA
jgi:cell division protein ZipA